MKLRPAMVITALALLAFAPSRPHTATIPDSLLAHRLVAICVDAPSATIDRLRDREFALAGQAGAGGQDVQSLRDLACIRGWLAAADARSREGFLMPLGTSWRHGSSAIALVILRTRPGDEVAASLLAALNQDLVLADADSIVGPPLAVAVTAKVHVPLVLRVCSEVNLRGGNRESAIFCSRRALDVGVDSAFHLLALAREHARTGDGAATEQGFLAAIAAAHDTAAVASVTWHLRWFLSPAELATWDSLPATARSTWVGSLLAGRDVRDGRPRFTRVLEHFSRLEYALEHFTLRVLPINRQRVMTMPAIPDGGGSGGIQMQPVVGDPALQATLAMRQFDRWQTLLDDRGAVWMRFGPPTKRRLYLAPDSGNFIRREAWLYLIDGRELIIAFESEQGDGSDEATRLAVGSMGEFFCGLDIVRCILANRAIAALELRKVSLDPLSVGVPVETVANLREADREYIREATTKDDNAVRTERHLQSTAQLLRVWDPRTGRPMALVPWSVRIGDLAAESVAGVAAAVIELQVRAWDPVPGREHDTTVTQRFRLPARAAEDARLTGVIALPISFGITSWSVFFRQGDDRSGRIFATNVAPIAEGALMISDLVIGTESQGARWSADEPIILGPLGAFATGDPIQLFFQVRSRTSRSDVRTSIVITPMSAQDSTSGMQISFDGRVGTGLSEVRRELDVRQLRAGNYRLEVRIEHPTTGDQVTRSTTLLLR